MDNDIFKFMSKATDIESWNRLRMELIKSLSEKYEGEFVKIQIDKVGTLHLPVAYAMIATHVDGSGLINEVLKK